MLLLKNIQSSGPCALEGAKMNTKEDVENLEKLIGQLNGLHSEISQLAKKSPNDGLNIFKLKLVNKVLSSGNERNGE